MNKLTENVGKPKSDHKENGWEVFLTTCFYLNTSKARWHLFILLAITLFFGTKLNDLRFNYSFNSFFPEGDDDLAYYNEFIDEFGQFNDFLFVVLKNKEGLTQPFLDSVELHKQTLDQWPEVKRIESPLDLKGIQITPFGTNTYPLLPKINRFTPSILDSLGMLGNYFGREDGSVLLWLEHETFEAKPDADAFYLQLSDHFSSAGLEDFVISGKIQMQYDFTLKLEKELSRLLGLGLLVIVLILFLLFRSWKGLILPLVVLLITLIWTMGLMAWLNKPIDVMVVMIPPILLVVALSDVIHFVHKYDELKLQALPKQEAIRLAVKTIGKATFLTSATTATGFLGLLFLPITPIKEFGLLTAAGVLLAFVVTFLSLPALLYFYPSTVQNTSAFGFSWERTLYNLHGQILKRPRFIVAGTLLLCLASVWGISKLELSTSLIVGLQRNEPELEKVAYFDKNYDGYKPFELGIKLSDNADLFSPEVVEKMGRIENYLQQKYGVAHVQSPLSLIREINAGLYGGARKYATLPQTDDLDKVRRYYYSPRLRTLRNNVQSINGKMIRMLGRTKDLGSAHYHPLNDSLNVFLASQINGNGLEAKLTGASYLIDKTDSYVVRSLIKGLGFALLCIGIFVLLAFRSWLLAFIALIPNVLPICLLFGSMGLLAIDLNISTAIIFTVALGIAVDDSIHFIARFQQERQGSEQSQAVKNTFVKTGKSIVVTSIVIALGFAVFLASGFSAAFYLGFFIVLAALLAVLFDLTILPIILRRIGRKKL
ncbi:MMPL family transporter [Roseivirga sp. UBA1976]|uniref:efflux RND transporter permease subunit n=1 Tax=Roseivirga sp. UBA1976 TaxID=1947386 RepID=UPI0025794442|nr:MMPL family transporter [Roseivirga sp. UBA1976]